MPRLSRTQEDAKRHIADLSARCLAPEALGRKLLSALHEAIPFDGGRLFGIDPSTLLINRVLAATDSDGWGRLEWFRDIYLALEPLVYLEMPSLMQAGLHAVAFHDRQDTCWGYPREMLGAVAPDDHYRLFHELRSPVGGTLHACFPAGGRWTAALQIYRREAAHAFRPGEVAFLRLIAPTIGAAMHAALARERATTETPIDTPEATGILMLNRDTSIRFSTPAGESWCRIVQDAERHGHGPLPSAVWSAVAGLRVGGNSRPTSVVTAASPAGPVRIEASPSGEDGGIAVVFAPDRSPAPPGVPAHWPLTHQRGRLVSLLIRGHSNRQSGDALTMSENTVEWHLRNTYERLGVRSRTQLLARFFREIYWPGLAACAEGNDSW
ncbi:MAG: LuxR C-terminal-related transcriptional regulator [Dehalococcoidia bacterium]